METLQTICRTMLDNANMDIDFTKCPFAVRLTFYVIGSDKKVIFDCSDIEKFSITKDASDCPEYVCLEVDVTTPKMQRPAGLSEFEFEIGDKANYLWHVEILPEAHIEIKCLNFAWQIQPMTVEEMDERNK